MLFCLFSVIAAGKDFYKILGVKRSASDGEIKKAYRSLAKKYHPDRFPDEKKKKKAEAKFMDIAKAYETLSDPEQRRIYDQVGEEGMQNGGQPGGGRRGPQFQRQGGGGGMPGGFENIFSQMFGGGFGGGRQRQHPQGGGFQHGRNFGSQGRRQQSQNQIKFTDTKVKIVKGSNEAKTTFGTKYRAEKVWFVLLHTKALNQNEEKSFADLAEKYSGVLNFAALDCSENENSKLCLHYKYDSSTSGRESSLLLLSHAGTNSVSESLTSSRGKKNIIKSGLQQLKSDFISPVSTEKEMKSFLKKCVQDTNVKACIVVASDKAEPSSLLKVLSAEFKKRLRFAHWSVPRSEQRQVLRKHGVKKLPALLMYANDASNRIEIDLNQLETLDVEKNDYATLHEALSEVSWSRKRKAHQRRKDEL